MQEVWLLLDSRRLGGIETHVAELAAGLAEAGENPRVLFLTDYGPHPLRVRLDDLHIAWEALAGGLTALRRRLAAGRPRVLHTHGYKANIAGRLAALPGGVPVVATYHAGERPAGRLAVYDVLDRYTSFAGRRIAVSRPILARLPFGGTLIPNFVAVPPDPPQAGPTVVAFVGRMSAEKGPDQFCTLASLLPQAAFSAYGDGPMLAEVQRLSAGRVDFKGAVAGMQPHWRDIGLLAITSRGEGLPLAALEAMAHGVPVASFALGGLPDLIEEGRTGYLAPPGDIPALAEAVARWLALAPQARTAMAQAGWQAVRARYGRQAGIAAVRALYPPVQS